MDRCSESYSVASCAENPDIVVIARSVPAEEIYPEALGWAPGLPAACTHPASSVWVRACGTRIPVAARSAADQNKRVMDCTLETGEELSIRNYEVWRWTPQNKASAASEPK